jgi:transposase
MDLAVLIDSHHPDHRLGVAVPSDQHHPRPDMGRVAGLAERGPAESLVAFGVEVGHEVDLRAAEQLDEIAGVGVTSAQELIAELGADMTRFPTAGHLASWAKFAPIDRKSAGKAKGASAGKGHPWLAAILGEIVTAAARTGTFLGERYHRISRRRGKRRAIVATGNSVLTITWNVLSDPDARYHDLGPGYYHSRTTSRHRERDLIRSLERLTGKTVTPQSGQPPAA